MKKVAIVILILLFGANIANLSNMLSSISLNKKTVIELSPPKNAPLINEFDDQTKGETNVYNYYSGNEQYQRVIAEAANYILHHSVENNFEFTSMLYSTAIIFESKETLIVIGHGYKNTYITLE